METAWRAQPCLRRWPDRPRLVLNCPPRWTPSLCGTSLRVEKPLSPGVSIVLCESSSSAFPVVSLGFTILLLLLLRSPAISLGFTILLLLLCYPAISLGFAILLLLHSPAISLGFTILLLLLCYPAISLGFTILLFLLCSQLYLWSLPFFFFFFCVTQLYLWGLPFFFFCVSSYISEVYHSSSSSALPSYICGVYHSSSSAFPVISLEFTILLLLLCSPAISPGFTILLLLLRYPARSLEFTILLLLLCSQLYLWGLPVWVRCSRMLPFFHPTIEVVTFCLWG